MIKNILLRPKYYFYVKNPLIFQIYLNVYNINIICNY